MKYLGDNDHSISLFEAADLTTRFRENLPVFDYTIAEFFGKSALENLLSQDSCVGIRVYYGLDAEMKRRLVIVGVDDEGNDLYKDNLMEGGALCPPVCSEVNPLNT